MRRRHFTLFFVCIVSIAAPFATPTLAVGAPQTPAAVPAAPRDDPKTPVADESATPPPLTGPRVQQDTFTAADEAPGSRNVNVSFADNFIADRLPFDVPFNVTGSVDPAVKRLELSVYRVSSNVDLARLIEYLQTSVDCVGKQPPGRLTSKSAVTPGANGRFSLFVNALEPQYYYALCFVGVTPVPSSEIETDARRLFAALVPRLDTGGDISLALLADVRGAMRDRIAQIGAGRSLPATIPKGNLFESETMDPRFLPLVGPIANPYLALGTFNRNYERALKNLHTHLEEARQKVGITTELIAALPSADSKLPTPDTAIRGNAPFAASAFSFDSARKLLDTAIEAAADRPDELAVLNRLGVDLQAVVIAAKNYGSNYDQLRNSATAVVNFIALEARVVTVTLGSSVLSADLARSAYVSLDAGVAYPWRLESMVFYAGTNIYFRPINKAAPLRYKGTFLHRFALTVGVTTTVKDESRRAEDLRATADNKDTSNSLLLGAGLRVTPSLRVGGGVLVFKETDPNPLIDQKSVAVTPYVAFTADVDVARIFRSLF